MFTSSASEQINHITLVFQCFITIDKVLDSIRVLDKIILNSIIYRTNIGNQYLFHPFQSNDLQSSDKLESLKFEVLRKYICRRGNDIIIMTVDFVDQKKQQYFL